MQGADGRPALIVHHERVRLGAASAASHCTALVGTALGTWQGRKGSVSLSRGCGRSLASRGRLPHVCTGIHMLVHELRRLDLTPRTAGAAHGKDFVLLQTHTSRSLSQ